MKILFILLLPMSALADQKEQRECGPLWKKWDRWTLVHMLEEVCTQQESPPQQTSDAAEQNKWKPWGRFS
ncbi:hypothetical protein CCS41_01795 [Candidatus Fukatsuia symbiotica]|uniref:Uncharacterized protein n=1 Tax=Candidatus Fukatsuia symbiotica TaxID=1878942 RepID=A0A2U8I330_9GAMM|nr:hypothetical protein CCS41_01795 [Candidatus Fukatsuia symbiotica]